MEIIIGALIGIIASLTLQAYFRPFAAFMERIGRRHLANPLLIHVERDPSIIWSGEPDWIPFSVYVDDPLRMSQITAEDRSGWIRQARQINAVDAYMTTLKITIQAKVDAAVVIEAFHVVKYREVPLDGGMVLTRTTGGADLEPRRVEVELDWGPEPLVTWIDDSEKSTSSPAFALSAGEAERFHVWAKASHGPKPIWYEWYIELRLLVEGNLTVQTIDDNGAPFVTVSPGDLPSRFKANGTEWLDPTA